MYPDQNCTSRSTFWKAGTHRCEVSSLRTALIRTSPESGLDSWVGTSKTKPESANVSVQFVPSGPEPILHRVWLTGLVAGVELAIPKVALPLVVLLSEKPPLPPIKVRLSLLTSEP